MSHSQEPPKVRNWNAVAAWFRRGGPMRHRNTPRGGASNESRDLKDQGREELEDEEYDEKVSEIPEEEKK